MRSKVRPGQRILKLVSRQEWFAICLLLRFKTLLTIMNCCVFLDISVARPKMWFDFITGPEMDIFVD